MSRSSKNNDKDKSKKDNSKKRKHGDEGSNNNDADNVLPFGEKPTHLTIINEKGWKALSNAVSNRGNKRVKSTFKRLISSITENCGEHKDKSNENDGGHEGMDYSNMDSLNTEDYLQKLRDTYIQESINNLDKIKTELDNDEQIKQQIEQH